MNNFLKSALASLLLLSATSVSQAQHLTIITANDTHSTIQPADDQLGGVLRHKAIVDSIRKAEPNFIAVHCGDAVQGTNYFSMFGGEVEYAAIDSVGYDIAILGNHEFDNGVDELAKYYPSMKAMHLSANYDFCGTPLEGCFRPYVIKHYEGKKVAFIGLSLLPTGMISDNRIAGITYYDSVDTALRLSDYLKETKMADYVIVVTHIGYLGLGDSESDVLLAKKSRNIDIILGGHSHTLVDPAKPDSKYRWRIPNAEGRDVVIAQSGKYGKYTTKLNLDLNTGEVTSELITVDRRFDAMAAKHTAMRNWLKPYDDAVAAKMNKVVCQCAQDMPNSGLGMLSNWVTDVSYQLISELSGIKLDCTIMNRGGYRQNIFKGDVTEGLLEAVMPFDNRFTVLDMKGSLILESLEIMARRGGDAVSKQLDVVFEKGGKIVSAKINGKPIDPDKMYKVGTIDYLANGGDYMAPMKSAEKIYLDTVPYGRHFLKYCQDLGKAGKPIVSTDKLRMRLKK